MFKKYIIKNSIKIKNFELKINSFNIFLVILILLFILSIFYNLYWGSPYYFHPDERNIASSVSQLHLFNNFNPHFFAYGAFPIYSIYIVGLIVNFISNPLAKISFDVNFEQAIIISRIISSVFTTFTIFLIFKIARSIYNKLTASIALILSMTSVGYLQYSHFGTFEMWLSFFYLFLFYLLYLFLKERKLKFIVFASIVLGVAISIKISSIVLIMSPIIIILYASYKNGELLEIINRSIKLTSIVIFFSSLTYLILNPYSLMDNASFIGALRYESSVALGTLPVFYSGSFYNTNPILFQYAKILPFLINPVLTILAVPAILLSLFAAIKKKNVYIILLITVFIIIFVSQSILFVKWSRYIVPSISFLYIFIAVLLSRLKLLLPEKVWRTTLAIIFLISFIFPLSFVKTVRLTSDARVSAATFAKENIERNSFVLSEVYDLGIIPFNQYLKSITLFNFYALDDNPQKSQELQEILDATDYIILPSQRILRSRLIKNGVFPTGYKFYKNLLSGNSGFEEVYKTPCDVFCKIVYLGNPIITGEETINIFDRPTVFIFKRPR